jgi:signal transduction histidine kinase
VVAELSLQIAGGPGAPAEARSALRRFHPDLPLDLMQVIVLLTSELVANAVRHAAAEWIAIRFSVVAGHVRVDVGDEGPGFEAEIPAADPGADGGWGLRLVDELADRWGVADDAGSRVWFEIDR